MVDRQVRGRPPTSKREITVRFPMDVPKELRAPFVMPDPMPVDWPLMTAPKMLKRFGQAMKLFGLTWRDLEAEGQHVAFQIFTGIFPGLQIRSEPSKETTRVEILHRENMRIYPQALGLRYLRPDLTPMKAWVEAHAAADHPPSRGTLRNRWSALQHDPVLIEFEKLFARAPEKAITLVYAIADTPVMKAKI